MRILIIGSAGFIGREMTIAAARAGHEVFAVSRAGLAQQGSARSFSWSFGKAMPSDALEKVDSAIILAHDFSGPEGAQSTFDGTIALASVLRGAGVKRQLFFSSYSSSETAPSLYGRTKFKLEQVLGENYGSVIIRPGLVIGGGGLYGRIQKVSQILPIIPLPDGGSGKVPVIDIQKLCKLTLELAEDNTTNLEANLFEDELKTLRQLVLDAAGASHHKPFIISVPSFFYIAILRLASTLHIRLPVNEDNLIGFLANQTPSHLSSISLE